MTYRFLLANGARRYHDMDRDEIMDILKQSNTSPFIKWVAFRIGPKDSDEIVYNLNNIISIEPVDEEVEE